MDVCFVSAEPDERAFFAERLARWKPGFVDELDEVPEEVEVLSIFIKDGIEEQFLAAHPRLRLIATRSTGVDHIDMEACRQRNVRVACVGGSDGNGVAEHTFALLLAVARRLRASGEVRRQGEFSREQLRGFELRGKTLGLIGVGRIGARVAELARAFGMQVVAYDPKPDPELAARIGFRYAPLDAVLAKGEILSLHAALTPATRHLLDAAALAKCQPGVVIINTARGALIDTPALVQAIESGQVGGVGLDVLEDERVLRADAKNILSHEIADRVHRAANRSTPGEGSDRRRQIEALFSSNSLLARPEVVFTPHIAFNTTESVENIAGSAARHIEDFLEGRDLA